VVIGLNLVFKKAELQLQQVPRSHLDEFKPVGVQDNLVKLVKDVFSLAILLIAQKDASYDFAERG
jgi:hypothetical protein